MLSPEEQARVELAQERDAAIARANEKQARLQEVAQKAARMQQDMVRWVICFMLQTTQHQIKIGPGDLKKSDQYRLSRQNLPSEDRILWRIDPK